MHAKLATALALTTALLGAAPAIADQLIYSNFSEGTGDPNNPYTNVNVNGFGVQWSLSQGFASGWATPFTVPTGNNVALQSISLAMYNPGTNPTGGNNANNMTILLATNAGGIPSSTILETLSVNPSIPVNQASFLDLTSVLHPELTAGATYWVIAEPTTIDLADGNQDSLFYWIQNDENALFDYTIDEYTTIDNQWTGWFNQSFQIPAPTLEVFAESPATVPEPGALALLGAGLAGLAIRRRRRA